MACTPAPATHYWPANRAHARRSWVARLALLHANRDAAAVYPAAAPGAEGVDGLGGGPPAPAYSAKVLAFISGLFEQFVDPLLSKLRAQCRFALPSMDINLVTSVAHLFMVSWGTPAPV